MTGQNTTRVWLKLSNNRYYPMAAGLTSLQIKAVTTLLETPVLDSPLCRREILSHTAQVEFEGFRDRDDEVCEYVKDRFLKRGDDAKVTFVTYDSRDVRSSGTFTATRQTGYLCVENPGTGSGPLGGRMKGKIVYASEPEEGTFDEQTRTFDPF